MHRTSSKARPLSLQRETVRVLASSDLASVQGGAGAIFRRAYSDDNRVICHIDIPDIVIPRAPGGSAAAGNGCQPTWTLTDSIVINPSIIGRP